MAVAVMDEHPNAARIRRFYESLADGSFAALTQRLFAPDIVWHVPGDHPLAGNHRGRDAVLAAMRAFEEASGGTIQVTLHDVLANDRHAVALLLATGERNGRRYRARELDVFHIEDAKVTELWSLSEDRKATDEFWS